MDRRGGRWLIAGGRSVALGLVLAASNACGRTSSQPAQPFFTVGSAEIQHDVERLLNVGRITCTQPRGAAAADAATALERAAVETEARRWLRASLYYEQAAEAFARAGGPCAEIDARNNQLKTRRRSSTGQARQIGSRTLDRAIEAGYFEGAATTLNNLGVVESNAQNLRRAHDLFSAAGIVWRQLGAEKELANLDLVIGQNLFRLGRLDDAEAKLRRAMGVFEANDPGRAANSVTWLARVELAQGQVHEARTTLERALGIRLSLEGQPGIEATLDALGRAHLEAGAFAEAERTFNRALERIADKHSTGYANVLGNLAELYVRWERAEEGIEAALESLEILGVGDRANPSLSMHDLFFQARGLVLLGRREEAVSVLEEMLQALESLRAKGPGDLSIGVVAIRRSYLDFTIQLLLDLGRVEEAFDVAERVRSRGLLDGIGPFSKERRAQASPRLLEQEQRLRGEIGAAENKLRRLVAGQAEEAALAAAEERMRSLLVDLDNIGSQVDSELMTRYHRPLLLERLRTLLDDETVVISYWLGEERGTIWAVGREGKVVSVSQQMNRDLVEWSAEQLRRLVAAGDDADPIKAEADQLARWLLHPVAASVAGKKRIVIVPDGALSVLPFTVLPFTVLPFTVLPQPATNGSEASRLIDQHVIIQVHSLSVLAAIRAGSPARHARQEIDVAVVAPTYAPGSISGRPRLEGAEREARGIAQWLGASSQTLLFGDEARRSAILAGALDHARLIHFAAHAELDAEYPDFSYVQLADPGSGFDAHEARLRIQDVEGIDLVCDVMFMAACRTGLGKRIRGEGPMAFPRAALRAGAASVIASLWEVDDHATAELVKHFYQALARGLPPAESLREAQMTLANSERWQDPSAWAGFIIVGDWQP